MIGGPFLGTYIKSASILNLTVYSSVKIGLAIGYLILVKQNRLNTALIIVTALFIRALGGPFMFTLIGACVVNSYLLKKAA